MEIESFQNWLRRNAARDVRLSVLRHIICGLIEIENLSAYKRRVIAAMQEEYSDEEIETQVELSMLAWHTWYDDLDMGESADS